MSTVTIDHPLMGTVVGRDGDGVEQFLGVRYATLEDRLAESRIRSTYQSPLDATRHG
jgi:carboxylesterase type B